MKTLTSLDVTEDKIRALLDEAQGAGDLKMVKSCQLALAGDVNGFSACLEALRAAKSGPEHTIARDRTRKVQS